MSTTLAAQIPIAVPAVTGRPSHARAPLPAADACVPTWGTDEWVRELGFAQKDGGGWRAWTSPLEYGAAEQRAGYVVDYDVNDFKFVTVQGAGHMIPLYKPYFALTMISKFLKNEAF